MLEQMASFDLKNAKCLGYDLGYFKDHYKGLGFISLGFRVYKFRV